MRLGELLGQLGEHRQRECASSALWVPGADQRWHDTTSARPFLVAFFGVSSFHCPHRVANHVGVTRPERLVQQRYEVLACYVDVVVGREVQASPLGRGANCVVSGTAWRVVAVVVGVAVLGDCCSDSGAVVGERGLEVGAVA